MTYAKVIRIRVRHKVCFAKNIPASMHRWDHIYAKYALQGYYTCKEQFRTVS